MGSGHAILLFFGRCEISQKLVVKQGRHIFFFFTGKWHPVHTHRIHNFLSLVNLMQCITVDVRGKLVFVVAKLLAQSLELTRYIFSSS